MAYDEKKSPHSLLLKDLHDNKCKGRPTTTTLKQKYKTLSWNVCGTSCRNCFKIFLVSSGLSINEFCILLIEKLNQINAEYICNETEWKNIFVVIERFAMKLS